MFSKIIASIKTIFEEETLAHRSQRMIPAAIYGALIASIYSVTLAFVNVYTFPKLPLGMDWERTLTMWLGFGVAAALFGALAAWFTGQAKPADELIVRAAAEVRRAAGSVDETNRQRLLAALGEATTAVVVKRAVAGARWQKPGGCGADFEEPTPAEAKVQGMMACGMGFVPPLCERFLDLYTAGR